MHIHTYMYTHTQHMPQQHDKEKTVTPSPSLMSINNIHTHIFAHTLPHTHTHTHTHAYTCAGLSSMIVDKTTTTTPPPSLMSINLGGTIGTNSAPSTQPSMLPSTQSTQPSMLPSTQAPECGFMSLNPISKLPSFAGRSMHSLLQQQHSLLQHHDAGDNMGLDEILSLPWLDDNSDGHMVSALSVCVSMYVCLYRFCGCLGWMITVMSMW